jgi:hypothetical protein
MASTTVDPEQELVPWSTVASLCLGIVGATVCWVQVLTFPYDWETRNEDSTEAGALAGIAVYGPSPSASTSERLRKEAADEAERFAFGERLGLVGRLIILTGLAGLFLAPKPRHPFVWVVLILNGFCLIFAIALWIGQNIGPM